MKEACFIGGETRPEFIEEDKCKIECIGIYSTTVIAISQEMMPTHPLKV